MKIRAFITCLASLVAFQIGSAIAGPADYIYTPLVEEGEREIEFKSGTAEDQDGVRKTVSMLGVGYGATDYWFTEIYLKHEHEGSGSLDLIEFENKFQLTETGKYPVDLGVVVELEFPINDNDEPNEFKFGPLLQTDLGMFQLNTNLLFERKFGGNDDGDHVTEMGYQVQGKYRLRPEFEFGFQGMGEMGEWDDWNDSSEQEHKLGPAIFGKFKTGQKQAIKYNAAILYGVSKQAPDQTFRMQAEYEF